MLLFVGAVCLSVLQASGVVFPDDSIGGGPLATEPLSINGTIFNDLNGNGLRDDGEPGLSGWKVRLMSDEEEVSNVTSDDSGGYIFEGLLRGSYLIAQEMMPGWNQTTPGGQGYKVTLEDNDGQRYDFGNFAGGVLTTGVREYPLMRPSVEELLKWIEASEMAPKVEINQEIATILEVSPTGSKSLLNYLLYDPIERDQGRCGNCWAWAGTGVMEVGLAAEDGVKDRLSIQYLNSNYNGGSGSNWACCGGNLAGLASFYGGKDKTIPWSNTNAHWQDGGRSCSSGSTSVPAGLISTTNNYPITTIVAETIPTQGVGSATAIANIKNVLNQNRAVFFGYYLPTDDEWDIFIDFWSLQPESSVWDPTFPNGKAWIIGEGAGHAVLCVGYDDTDPNNKYWIMLNSWRTTPGRPNGLFRVDMDMNYDCKLKLGSEDIPAFFWETLNLEYDLPLTQAHIIVFRDGVWFVDIDGDQAPDSIFWFGAAGDVPVIGDFDDDGTDDHALFRNGVWFVDLNGDHSPDDVFWYGAAGDVPVVGDFDNDGTDDLALFRNGVWFVDVNGDRNPDIVFWYGAAGDVPVVGDFNNDGADDFAVFRNGVWFVDVNGDHSPDSVFWYGAAGDVPVVGDFNNDGTDDFAVFRNGVWFVDVNGDHSPDSVFWYGAAGDIPRVGDAA
jgi:hypothetical protein